MDSGIWGPVEAHRKTHNKNTLSSAFLAINPLHPDSAGVSRWENLGFIEEPLEGDSEMDRNGGRFGGQGRFNRGGREGRQYR